MAPRLVSSFTIKLAPGDLAGKLSAIERVWKKHFADVPYEYSFLDETFAQMYVAEMRFQKVYIILVILAIIISCLGVFALATSSAEQRIKEICIRKVLGASVSHIVGLLSRDFLKLVLIAIVLATPLAAWAMGVWLEGFAYHTEIRWWVFAIASVLALVIAFLTVSSQAIRAAITDPAKTLRDFD